MVDAYPALALPWLESPLADALVRRGHALLLHGPRGVGQFELALSLAQAWLCEQHPPAPMPAATAESPGLAPRFEPPCGVCASCKLVRSHNHPDLLVLLPDALKDSLGWVAADDAGEASADKVTKAKPSKDIKVEAVRGAVSFAQSTSARGRAKVVVLHPAERMNAISANALLKTLEEPPGRARFVLSCSAPDALLPTIRSRCQAVTLAPPEERLALAWLSERGVDEPAVLLAATGGQPQDVLTWVAEGMTASLWAGLPRQLAGGEAGPLATLSLSRIVDVLLKLCHDAMRVTIGAAPRYFASSNWPPVSDMDRLLAWSTELRRIARHGEHPWSQALAVDALVQQAQVALAPAPGLSRSARGFRYTAPHE